MSDVPTVSQEVNPALPTEQTSAQDALIIAFNHLPESVMTTSGGLYWLGRQILDFAHLIRDKGVCIQVSGPLIRSQSYGVFTEVLSQKPPLGVRVVADLQLSGSIESLAIDAALLRAVPVDLDHVTIHLNVGVTALREFVGLLRQKKEGNFGGLPLTAKVYGVAIPKSLSLLEMQRIYGAPYLRHQVIDWFAQMAIEAGLDGMMVAPEDLIRLRATYESQLPLIAMDVFPKCTPSKLTPRQQTQLEDFISPAVALQQRTKRLVVDARLLDLEKSVGLPARNVQIDAVLAEIAENLALFPGDE